MKTARRIAPALMNRLTIPCFARCCLCSHYSGNWPRRKKRRSDPNGACAQQPLILPPLLLMMVAAGGPPPSFYRRPRARLFPDWPKLLSFPSAPHGRWFCEFLCAPCPFFRLRLVLLHRLVAASR